MQTTTASETVESCVRELGTLRRKRQRAAALLLTLTALVTVGVFWQLHSTGIAATNEVFCGLEEHTHTDACYESVLTCGLEESEGHTHTADCYDENGNLVCGLEESEGHTHTDACYETTLTCGLEEHTHTAACLSNGDADTESTDDTQALSLSASNSLSDDGASVTAEGDSTEASIVLNLGNGNGTSSLAAYVGGTAKTGDAALRYTVDVSNSADSDGTVTVNLPSDSNLGTTFNVTESSTVSLSRESVYDYKLVGWINIATGEYYDVSSGSTTAKVDLNDNNVFYADWVAASYDHSSTNDATAIDTADTSDFVQIRMFDYNELFNLYSTTLSQNGLTSETWAVTNNMYTSPVLTNSLDSLKQVQNALSLVFFGTDIAAQNVGSLGNPNGRSNQNLWTANVTSVNNRYLPYQGILGSLNASESYTGILDMLFDTDEEALGVNYVGEGNYLFSYDESTGYYSYDSDKNAAVYNQSAGRFYVYDSGMNLGGSGYGGFLPYNDYTGSAISKTDGTVNYWFGVSMELDFYLPNDTGTTGGNQITSTAGTTSDMVFEFSGDDDIWVFVDGELVLDMGGIHSQTEGEINFSTGTVTIAGKTNYKKESFFSLGAGAHTMTIYYMERGASDSNLQISFNIVPRWKLETADAGTMSVTKEWKDADGNTIDDVSGYPNVTMGLFEKTSTEASTNSKVTYDTVSYTLDGDGYSYDDSGQVNAYVSGGYLYVLVDTEAVGSENSWTYTWEMLDIDKTYEVLELTTLSNYKTTSSSTSLQSYNYWSAVSGDDLNGTVTVNDEGSVTWTGSLKDDLEVILTDGAQNGSASSDEGYPTTYTGYVITSTSGSIFTMTAQFSQSAQATGTTGVYSYGVTSDTYVSDSVWTVEMTGEYASSTVSGSTVYAPTFYLKDSSGKYLAITDTEGSYDLTTVENSTEATAFSYNTLGELNTSECGGLRVLITSEGYSITTLASSTTDTSNVKIYVRDTATQGKAYTVTNTQLPTITLKKVSSTSDSTTLGGAVFTLQDSSGKYYNYSNNAVAWVDSSQLTTDDNGVISFIALPDGTYTLTEVTAPDGYNVLNSAITVVVENGKVTSAIYGEDNSDASNSETSSTVVSVDESTGLVLTVTNAPGVELPNTGGSGTLSFALAGLALCAGAGALLLGRRRGRA